ncbi:hypothetical protein MLD38_021891 [Melastoma candidum]|uniref:Uncharacterized protein n=1 Tax=Melastoma candidum TaxID=119954 RepID=A0ACB9QHL1_9MYRT|nr:hypothetical protein MLD38_021891 [Melastoma candidum]
MCVPEAEMPYQSDDIVTRNSEIFWQVIVSLTKAHFLLLSSNDDLEAFEALKARFCFPVFIVGPGVLYVQLQLKPSLLRGVQEDDYSLWLDSQPNKSVLYVSLGSYLSIPSCVVEREFWFPGANKGAVASIGWRILESLGVEFGHGGIFAGVRFLTYPIALDQDNTSKMIVDNWQIGQRVSGDIAPLNCNFMDLEVDHIREMRSRAKSIQRTSHGAIGKDRSSEGDIRTFIGNLLLDQGTSA